MLACCYCLVTKSCLTLGTPWAVAHQALLSVGFPRSTCVSFIGRRILYHLTTMETHDVGLATCKQFDLSVKFVKSLRFSEPPFSFCGMAPTKQAACGSRSPRERG